MTISRKSLADTIDGYDVEIAAMQESKRETFQAYREELAAVMGKDAVKAEIEAVKKAIRRRQIMDKKGAEVVEEADALVDAVFAEISARAPRATRSAIAVPDESNPRFGAWVAEVADRVDPELLNTIIEGSKTEAGRSILMAAIKVVKEGHAESDLAETRPDGRGKAESASGEAPDTAPHSSLANAAHAVSRVEASAERQPQAETGIAGDSKAGGYELSSAEGHLPPIQPGETAPNSVLTFAPRVFRPNCLHPEACAGLGNRHCYTCTRVAENAA